MTAKVPGSRAAEVRLGRAKLVATAAVGVTAGLYLGAHFLPLPIFWQRLVAAGGEAGTVGGLADWFAVTALFRRPLGLPIPHTALIPARKNEIGRALARFVETHFLDPDILIARLRETDRAAELGQWLASAEAARFIAARLVGLLQELVERGTHLHLVDAALPLLETVSREARGILGQEIGKRTGRFVPRFVDRHLARAVADEIDRMVAALGTSGSAERAGLDRWLRERLDEIPPVWREAATGLWAELKREAAATDTLAGEPPALVATLANLIRRAGQALVEQPAARAWINAAIERGLSEYILPWRPQIGRYIEGVVRRWDPEQVTRIVELQVGRDLQYVRLNGTLIGAAIGIGLFLAGWGMGMG